jgi:hypothetical protein
MSTEETNSTNSLIVPEPSSQIATTSDSNLIPYSKKEFVFTEKRKENLVKANKARKEKEDFKKQLREKYEATTIELQKLYESKINSFKNNGDNSTPTPEMSSKKEKATAEIEIQQIPVNSKKVSEKNISDSSSDSDPSEIESSKKSKKRKINPKKHKKVVYVSESDSSEEEEIIVRKKKPKKRKPVYSESDSSDDDTIYQKSSARQKQPVYQQMPMPRKVGAISGCIF